MTTTYAKGTEVPVSRTREHIEALLTEHQAGSIGIMIDTVPPRATVMFRIHSWTVRMRIGLPSIEDFQMGTGSRERSKQRAEQAVRERWRALFLALKAKLISVETGVETFEEAFLPHLVLPGGKTVYEQVAPRLGSGNVELPQLPSGAA